MRIAGHPYDILSETEINCIFDSALEILEEMGMEVQNTSLLNTFAEAGWSVDSDMMRITFPSAKVRSYIEKYGTYSWSSHQPQVSSTAGVYHGLYLDPVKDTRTPWSEDILSSYFRLATSLSHIDSGTMLGCRLPVAPPLEPLYERFYCWKLGAQECGSIYIDEICPYLLDLYQVYAEHIGKPVEEVFKATVFVVPHLKLGYHEAKQIQFFWERGLRVRIGGGMPTMGGTTPATFAGSVTLNLAEQLALNIIEHTLYGKQNLHIESSISVMDMRTGIHPFGRPEMAITNIMSAQVARYLGASFSGHAGLTDAKTPSVESGAQKMMTAAATLLTSGSLWVDAGLLSADEIYSPIQMILDNEMLSALSHWIRDYVVDRATIGVDLIKEVGPGGYYMDQHHTVEHYKQQHWQPNIWTRNMLQAWIEEGRQIDVDEARSKFILWHSENKFQQKKISDKMESDLLKVILQAQKNLV